MTSRQVHYAADKDDLIAAIERAEKALQVKYVDAWAQNLSAPSVLESLLDWPLLGTSIHHRACGFFLILHKGAKVHMSNIKMSNGTIEFNARTIDNPSSIVMEVGGVFSKPDGVKEIAVGKLGTALQGRESLELYASYRKSFLKGFRCSQQSLWVGNGAQKLIDNGTAVNW